LNKKLTSGSALILIVIAQFLGTSLWFAGNAVAPQLAVVLSDSELITSITTVVQLGFILGTLSYAFFSVADRYPPSIVFLISAVLAAFFNLLIPLLPINLTLLLGCRFMVGFFLAGIYPVGMKIAADYFEKGLGTALGFLVGALVLGTAFPYLLSGTGYFISWKNVLWITSLLAITGGVIVGVFIPRGPFCKSNNRFQFNLISKIFKLDSLKSAASGYFGHMWELYTFWAFLPVLIGYLSADKMMDWEVNFLTFTSIAVGAISCAVGGIIASKVGSRTVAKVALAASGICCLLILVVGESYPLVWISLLICWGIVVTADSPQFSTLVAQSVPAEFRGTALTIVNSIGFALSVISIQLGTILLKWMEIHLMLALVCIGPAVGLYFFDYFYKKNMLENRLGK